MNGPFKGRSIINESEEQRCFAWKSVFSVLQNMLRLEMGKQNTSQTAENRPFVWFFDISTMFDLWLKKLKKLTFYLSLIRFSV